MSSIQAAIDRAETILPGTPAAEGMPDPRWQAIIAISEFIHSEPEAVWSFVLQWAERGDGDLRMCLATCLLEHLLEHHFDEYFPRVEEAAEASTALSDVVSRCWKFGQAEDPTRMARFDRLKRRCQRAG